MSWSFIDMPGNFAVVIHGEYDCVNCFNHNTGRSAHRFFSTRLSEGILTNGETAQPLRECLELIVEHDKPDAIVVLGTCPVEVIGDRFEVTVDAVSAETGVPMVALHTSGLKLSTQQTMIDWCFDTLAGLGDPAQAIEDRVALLGMPVDRRGQSEVRSMCKKAGVPLHGQFPMGASLDQWRGLIGCAEVLATDTTMFPKLMTRLQGREQQITSIPLPLGLGQSVEVYCALGTRDPEAMSQAIQPLVDLAQAAVDGFQSRWEGKRMAMTMRMHNSNRTDLVARDGLGPVRMFTEAGLEVTLLIQGSDDAQTMVEWRELLAANDLDLAFEVFPGPYAIGQLVARGGYDVACVADWVHNQVAETGVPAMYSHQTRPWLSGVAPTLRRVERLLERRS